MSFNREGEARRLIGSSISKRVSAGLAIVGLVLTILQLAPPEWEEQSRTWLAFVWDGRDAITAIALVLLVAWVISLQRGLQRLGSSPTVASQVGVEVAQAPELAPSPLDLGPKGLVQFAENLIQYDEVLNQLSQSGGHHDVRMIFATGNTVLREIEHVIRNHETKAKYSLRMLMIDPTSQAALEADPKWPDEVLECNRRLKRLRDEAEQKRYPINIQWKTYRYPPPVRALMFDEDHLWLGFMEWGRKEEDHWELHDPAPRKPFLYFNRDMPSSTQYFGFVKSWFDYQWEVGRTVDEAVAAGDASSR